MCLAVPGKIESVEGEDPLLRTGKVSFGGIVKTIHLGCVPEAKVGDYVLVHVGFALSTIDEKEAEEVFALPPADGRSGGAGARRGSMKFVDEYRDPDAGPAVRRGHPATGHPRLDAHGGLRRPDPRHRQVRHRRAAAAAASRSSTARAARSA